MRKVLYSWILFQVSISNLYLLQISLVDGDAAAVTNLNRLTSHSTAFSEGFRRSLPPTRPRKSSRRVLSLSFCTLVICVLSCCLLCSLNILLAKLVNLESSRQSWWNASRQTRKSESKSWVVATRASNINDLECCIFCALESKGLEPLARS